MCLKYRPVKEEKKEKKTLNFFAKKEITSGPCWFVTITTGLTKAELMYSTKKNLIHLLSTGHPKKIKQKCNKV